MNLLNCIVVNVADRKMTEERIHTKYDVTIQSGCSATDKRIADLSDDIGENISDKNSYYSEFTAMYWIWKHKKADYIGWGHYRRTLVLEEAELEKLMEEGYDVVMPAPMVFDTSIEKQYKECSPSDTWDTMIEVVKELYPNEADLIVELFRSNILFPCCLGVYTYDYFDSFCRWVFPILDETFRRVGDQWDTYQKRYPAFLGERLYSVFFALYGMEKKYKVVSYKVYDSDNDTINSFQKMSMSELCQRLEDFLKQRHLHNAKVFISDIIKSDSKLIEKVEFIQIAYMIFLMEQENRERGNFFGRDITDVEFLRLVYSQLICLLKEVNKENLDVLRLFMDDNGVSTYFVKNMMLAHEIENEAVSVFCNQR